jgi:type 1 fimbria pilin
MKHFFSQTSTAALVCALGAACLPSQQAQAADAGSLTIKATISKATCALIIGDNTNSPGTSSYKTLNLGNLASNNASGVSAAFSTFGTKKWVMFSLKDPSDPTKACDLSGSTAYQLSAYVDKAESVTTSGTSSFLKNKITAAQGGTNALVKVLFGGSSGGLDVALKQGLNPLGGWSATSVANLYLYAQFAYASAADATPGKFNFDLPITVTYK